MTYDAVTGTVICRSKTSPALKRDFQLALGAGWMAPLCEHIPDRYDRRKSLWEEYLVRYVSRYSTRPRADLVSRALSL